MVEGSDLHGNGINIAARLESLSETGGLCISGSVFEHVSGKVPFAFTAIGPQILKNIDRPIQVYRLEKRPRPHCLHWLPIFPFPTSHLSWFSPSPA